MLDLFAVADGLEALSRGAASAVFAEADRSAYDSIRQNVQKLGLTGATTSTWMYQVPPEEAGAGRRYDLVLLDPPYRTLLLAARPHRALPSSRTRAGRARRWSRPTRRRSPSSRWRKRTSRKYGSARLTLFEH